MRWENTYSISCFDVKNWVSPSKLQIKTSSKVIIQKSVFDEGDNKYDYFKDSSKLEWLNIDQKKKPLEPLKERKPSTNPKFYTAQ